VSPPAMSARAGLLGVARPLANSLSPPAVPMMRARREKVFGPGRTVPLNRNAKARIAAYAKAWSVRNKQPRQHKGPITRTFLEVLLWGFRNSRSGCCFPSYEAIPIKVGSGSRRRSTISAGDFGHSIRKDAAPISTLCRCLPIRSGNRPVGHNPGHSRIRRDVLGCG
jgi:hypothetical protein